MARKITAVSESGADVALHILGGEKLNIVLQLSRRRLTLQKLCRCMDDISEKEAKKALEELTALGVVTGISSEEKENMPEEMQYELTGLGKEAEPILKALENFGRLYLKAEELGLDPSRDGEPDWKVPKKDSKGRTLTENREKTGGIKLPEEGQGSRMSQPAKKRHGWLEADGCFLFYNSHAGFDNWYFFGIENGDANTADIWLITVGEYEEMKEVLRQGSAPSSDLCGRSIGILCNRSDLLPDQETFYVAIEDAMIEKSL